MEDLRIRRTYKLLKEALFELLSQKSFDEIKVNDICNVAMVHRTTFYSHFSDKYELLDYCIKDLASELTDKISKNTYTNIKEFYTNMIVSLLSYITDKRKVFKNILRKNSDNGILQIFTDECVSYIKNMLKKEEENNISHDVSIDVISQYYSAALISTITWWIRTDSNMTEKQLCQALVTLIFESPDHISMMKK